MLSLIIAVPLDLLQVADALSHLSAALERTHGYRVAAVPAPATPILCRLGAQQMFVAYVATPTAAPQPVVVRLGFPAAQVDAPSTSLHVQLLEAPASLDNSVRWLLACPAPASFVVPPHPYPLALTLHWFTHQPTRPITGRGRLQHAQL